MMFNEVRLLDCVAYGSEFGQEFNTSITTLKSGVERRTARWSAPLGRGSVMYTALKPEHHKLVRDAHMASLGAAIAFRFKDWTDFQAVDQPLGVGAGDSQTIQLIKTYPFGVVTLERVIKKPVVNTVVICADGVPIAATIDYTTGLVTVMAPVDSVLTWSGEFDIPVRFESDRLDMQPVARLGGGFALSCDVEIVEVRL